MTKNALIISGVAWDATWQRHHDVTTMLVKNGYTVDFLQSNKTSAPSFKKILSLLTVKEKTSINKRTNNIIDGINISTAKQLPPFLGSKYINYILYILFHKNIKKKKYDLIISYVPTDISIFILKKESYFIFDCVRAFSIWGGYSLSLYKNEQVVYNKYNKIICDSYFIKEVYLKKYKVTQVITPLNFLPFIIYKNNPKKIKKICYFGSISKHIDLEIFNNLIKKGYLLYFWGQIDSDIKIPTEVINMGYETDQSKLANNIVAYSDAIIIPYSGNMDGVFPAKLLMSMSIEMPIFISNFYDSVKLKEFLYVYNNMEDLICKINNFNINDYYERRIKMKNFMMKVNNPISFSNAFIIND